MQEKRDSSVWTIILLVFTTTLVRVFLEFFSNPDPGMIIGSWYGLLQYFIFFLAMTLGIGSILGTILKESFVKWTVIVSKSLPIVFLAPIIDLIVSGGKGICMAYSGSSGPLLVHDFITFFGNFGTCGITIGMRIEIGIILIAIGFILWKKTKAFLKIFAGLFIIYLFIFLNGIIPGIFGINTISALPIQEFVSFVSSIHFITAIIFIIIIWFYEKRSLFSAWMHNTRWERIVYYIFIVGLGMVTALRLYDLPITSLMLVHVCVALIAIIANGWAAAVFNDVADQDIDAISNQDRPLLVKSISLDTYKNLGSIFFFVAITGSLVIGYSFFLFMLGSQLLYATYSWRSSAWKTHFLSSSATIGLVGVFMAFAGYFMIAPDQSFSKIPLLFILVLFVTLAILSNAKDFKDVTGDLSCGIKTLPVLLGKRRAGFVLSLALSLWLIFLGFIFKNPIITSLALPWIILDLVIRKKIPEYVRFFIIFFEILIVMIMLK